METVLMVLFLLTGVILVLLVLIQRGRGGGLAGAFGGPGGHSAFGTQTADIFMKATAVLGAVFFALAVLTALVMRHREAEVFPDQQPPPAEAPADVGDAASAAGERTPAAEEGRTTAPADTKPETPAEPSGADDAGTE